MPQNARSPRPNRSAVRKTAPHVSLIEARMAARKAGSGVALPGKGPDARTRSLAGKVVLPYLPTSFTVGQLESAVRQLKNSTQASVAETSN